MKVTIETAKEFASNVMDSLQLADYNTWSGSSYETAEDLIENESAEKIAEFFTP